MSGDLIDNELSPTSDIIFIITENIGQMPLCRDLLEGIEDHSWCIVTE